MKKYEFPLQQEEENTNDSTLGERILAVLVTAILCVGGILLYASQHR